MKKKGFLVTGSVLAFLFLLLYPAQYSESKEKPLKLKFVDMTSPQSATAKKFEWWGSEIHKRTSGQISFDYYWGGSVIGAFEQMSSVRNNAIQVTLYYSGYHPDVAPLPLMALFPMMNTKSVEAGLKAADEFFRTDPEVAKEFEKNNVKYLFPNDVDNTYVFSKVPVKTLADFKGLSIRSFGPFLTFFSSLGCNLVTVAAPEVYNSLERGVVKATTFPLTYAIFDRAFEVTEYMLKTNLGHNMGGPVVMNLDTWKSLPAAVQQAIEQFNKNEVIAKLYELHKINDENEMKVITSSKLKINQLSDSDIKQLIEIARDKVWRPYAEKLDGKGVQGTKALNHYLQITEKYGAH